MLCCIRSKPAYGCLSRVVASLARSEWLFCARRTRRIFCVMDTKLRVAFAAAVLAAVATIAGAQASSPRPAQAGIDLAGMHGFDFLIGDWRVHHRRISAVSKKW